MTVRELLDREIGIMHMSPWFTVGQAMIERFADATLDRQYIHVDPERARSTVYGGTIAHGFLTLSLLPHLRDTIADLPAIPAKMRINYGFDRVRFVNPVRAGSEIRAHVKLAELRTPAPDMFDLVYDYSVEIRDEDKPALAAIWISRLIC